MSLCSVVLVTYNSQLFLDKAIGCLEKKTLPAHEIIIVDTGSKDKTYLKPYETKAKIVMEAPGAGFCRGNNTAMSYVSPKADFVFFLNPDAFITETFLEKAVSHMQQNPQCGALTGQTLGFDIEQDRPTGHFDTTGIFSTWYGRYYDRDQGKPVRVLQDTVETIPGICGAVFFCRRQALKQIELPGGAIFDPGFYMYKEDIDLSNRMRRLGWQLHFVPEIIAYHCRGWSPDRKKMPRQTRLTSAKNEIKIQMRERKLIGLAYSLTKYFLVKVFDQ